MMPRYRYCYSILLYNMHFLLNRKNTIMMPRYRYCYSILLYNMHFLLNRCLQIRFISKNKFGFRIFNSQNYYRQHKTYETVQKNSDTYPKIIEAR